jgi:hypothetical protein
MKPVRLTIAIAALLISLPVPAAARALPAGFFGIAPQTSLSDADTQYMSAGGIESIRVPVSWASVQPTPAAAYDWSSFDDVVTVAARARIRVLPFLLATPSWLEPRQTTLPVRTAAEQKAWVAFVKAIVGRYGPKGAFWAEHGPGTPEPLPLRPIRNWQIWNEANFYYFAFPASPLPYAKLLRITSPAIKGIDPGAKVILAGLFGKPDVGGSKGMPGVNFLSRLYTIPGVAADFDGVAVHPYAFNQSLLKVSVEGMRRVITANHDNASLYVTEIGWGSQNDPQQVAFERGPAGQAKELRLAYRYLISNQRRLGLRGVYWFSWKDLPESCSFCDSVGLFDAGSGFVPKPAWSTFVSLTGGRAVP